MTQKQREPLKIYLRGYGSQWGGAKVHLVGDRQDIPKCTNRSINADPVSEWPVDPFSASGTDPIPACKKCFPNGRPA